MSGLYDDALDDVYGDGTGVFVVMEEEECSPVRVPVPESFCLADTNPITGKPFARSWFRELPGYVAVVVRDRLDMAPGEWNVNIEDDTVSDWVDLDEPFASGEARIPEQRPHDPAEDVEYVVCAQGHAQAFHARWSFHPDYTWAQYQRDAARARGRRFEVVEVSDLDAPEAWL